MIRRQLFSWWKRWPLWWLNCGMESGHDFCSTFKEGFGPLGLRWIMGWCPDCGECRELL